MYDDNNIFTRIVRGEIPCRKIYEDEHVLAFHDIAPKAPAHALVIPKGRYCDYADFAAKGTDAEIVALARGVAKVADLIGVSQSGYRLIVNCGANANQEVPHYHVHIMGGRALGPMLTTKD